MKTIIKISNKIGYYLLKLNISICKIIGISLISKNHAFIDNKNNFNKIFKLVKGNNTIFISTTGVLIIVLKNEIIKYPLGNYAKKALHKEYQNYNLIKTTSLKEIVAYKLSFDNYYYKMDKLYESNDLFKNYKTIINLLKNNENIFWNIEELQNQKYFLNAFAIIKKHFKNNETSNILQFLKSKKIIKKGIFHGDLTQSNIMQNSKGKPVVIDLDRFSFNGILNLDRIHFIIDYFSKRNKDYFTTTINILLKTKNISFESYYLLLVYFLVRIGSEYQTNNKVSTHYNNRLNETFSLLYKRILFYNK